MRLFSPVIKRGWLENPLSIVNGELLIGQSSINGGFPLPRLITGGG
jgi:hypothetical protein